MTECDEIEFKPDEPCAEAAAAFLALAIRVTAIALRRQPADYALQLRQATDAGTCNFLVQADLPSGALTVIANGRGWPQPVVLVRMEPQGAAPSRPAHLARQLVERALTRVAPETGNTVRAALDSGDAAAAVIAEVPCGSVRVLVQAASWSEPRELLHVELPDVADVVPS